MAPKVGPSLWPLGCSPTIQDRPTPLGIAEETFRRRSPWHPADGCDLRIQISVSNSRTRIHWSNLGVKGIHHEVTKSTKMVLASDSRSYLKSVASASVQSSCPSCLRGEFLRHCCDGRRVRPSVICILRTSERASFGGAKEGVLVPSAGVSRGAAGRGMPEPLRPGGRTDVRNSGTPRCQRFADSQNSIGSFCGFW